jgi:hypothetical protein
MNLSEIKANVATNWKKYLIIGGCFLGILILSNVGTGLSCYCKGTKTCKPTSPVVITPADKPKEKTVVKNPICGEKIYVDLTMITDKKLQIKSSDLCKTTTAYYDFDYSCPVKKHQIGIGPSLLFVYDNEAAKFSYLIGGKFGYTHFWGNIGFGGQLGLYSSLDKAVYAGSIDAMITYRF